MAFSETSDFVAIRYLQTTKKNRKLNNTQKTLNLRRLIQKLTPNGLQA